MIHLYKPFKEPAAKHRVQAVLSLLFFLAACTVPARAALVKYYVDSTAGNDANAGTNWSAAFRNVTRAMVAANSSTASEVEIWIAHGTYTAVEGITALPADHRDTSFTFYRGDGIGKSLKVYGGFAGTETSIAMRDTSHHTILDGKIGAGAGFNSYHIIVITGLAAAADSVVMDGLWIQNAVGNSLAPKIYNSVSVAPTAGGGIYLAGDTTMKLAIRNCTIINNWTNYQGAGIWSTALYPVFTNCRIMNNLAQIGAGMFNYNSAAVITNCIFQNNKVHIYAANGGAIANMNSSVIIKNCSFVSNIAESGDASSGGAARGGAIYNFGWSSPHIDSCSFVSNITIGGTGGGGSDCYGSAISNISCSPVITNCSFSGNHGYSNYRPVPPRGGHTYGGAIYNSGVTGTIKNCSFDANTAVGIGYSGSSGYGGGQGFGGAICDTGSSLVISECTFSSDSAIGYFSGFGNGSASGGGIYDAGSTTSIINCKFTSESAFGTHWSGGNYGYGGAINVAASSAMKIDSCRFVANSAFLGGGGAVYVFGAKATATRSVFNAGTAGYGGAVSVGEPGSVMTNFTGHENVFNSNVSTLSGGGAVKAYISVGEDTMYNNLFIANKDIGYGGGALCLAGSSHFIANNTFYKDTSGANGGGVLGFSIASLVLANNIFYKNSGTGPHSDTSITGAVLTVDHNSYSPVDPLFVDETNPIGTDTAWGTHDDGLRLLSCSPARNAGANTYVLPYEIADLQGFTRIWGSTVDLGAYESNSMGAITGAHDLCVAGTMALADTSSGGTWSSSNPSIATISTSGVVTGVATGTDTVIYAITSVCGTDSARVAFHVIPPGYAGIVSGPSSVCVGDTVVLTDSITGGVWSVSNTDAAIDGTGMVTGITAGVDTVKYTNSCGLGAALYTMTIQALPVMGPITGPSSVCLGSSVVLDDTTVGGSWSTAIGNATISSGTATGITVGADTISYTKTNVWGCSATATLPFTVVTFPDAGTLSGPDTVCLGTSVTWTATTSGGTWSSTGAGVVTIDASGTVSGVAPGSATIVYTVTNACGTSLELVSLIVEDCSLLQAAPVADATIEVYPNPTTNNIHFATSRVINVSIYSLDGRLLEHKYNITDLPMGHFPDGTYLLVIFDENGAMIKTEKIVKGE